ncbi:cobalt-precorrin 5A acetaldehyde-lyase [Natronincola peptidivorans]|uniref:Cobalt-precorrin 5A acetaldehyde-lyase n=1 Tax=Natronincola peptidivorans TaxID=426128 RepID=A0A1I0CW17_9FIRM|nr:cobalt-precorrin 5A hydrolase [Natronincola peptidivorans]SET23954.1 cobalt-precorrin 5A acetaldehyde-lyase [Natronincola peptidivorans]
MKTAILTVTQGGKQLGLQIKKQLPQAQLYVLPKFHHEDYEKEAVLPIEPDLKAVVKKIFSQVDYLIFIMAAGIVVRCIAPYIKHKSQDPGVLVMDEKGQHVISLLSGHMGGANEFTLKIAAIVGGNPVITTASDVQNTMAVDTLAQRLNCRLKDWQMAKKITAAIVNNEKIGVYSEIPINIELPSQYHLVKNLADLSHEPYGIYIGNKDVEDLKENWLQLYPQNLVLGIGCRKDTTKEVLLTEIKTALQKIEKSIESIKKITTVDIKAEEKGLKETAIALEVPLEIFSREKLLEIETLFDSSPFVKETIGVGAVSEPCAYLGSQGGKMLLKKQKNQGVTISIAENNDL